MLRRHDPIQWLSHLAAALAMILVMGACGGPSGPPPQTRTYYIAADEVAWDYAPSGIDQITGEPFDEEGQIYAESAPNRIGRVNLKALYREYTDQTFTTLTTRRPADPAAAHLGTLGPIIRAVVGDTIEVMFKNNARFPFSIHPHGVRYAKNAEGVPHNDGTSGDDKQDDVIQPGATFRYRWDVPERSGPGPNDPSSVVWLYHSHVEEVTDTNAGLIGPIIITRRDQAKADGTPRDVDREFVTLYTIFDENLSPYLAENINRYTGDPATVDPSDEEFVKSNLKHAINGYIYGHVPGLTMRNGERVRWYVMGLGNETDLHTAHWHGQTLLSSGRRVDVVELLPASMVTADMVPDVAGTWLYHCHVNHHIEAGMQAMFQVSP